MAITTTVTELQVGDEIRWPDGHGGHIWPTVIRNLESDFGAHEILLGGIAAQMEDCPACNGRILTCVEKSYPSDLELIVRRAA